MPRKARRRLRGIKRSDLLTAQSEATVKYGPERSAINALLGEARGQYASDVQAAKAAGTSAIRAAKRARKPLRQIYEQATSAADVNAQDVSRAFSTLGAAADPFEAITTREMGAQKTRIAEAAARAQQDLKARQVEAAVGRQYALGQAKQDYTKNVATLAQRLRDLGSEEGAYMAGRLGSLRSERSERRAARSLERLRQRGAAKQAKRQHGYELEEIAAREQGGGGGGRGLGGSKGASRSELRMFKSDYAKALRYAKDYVDKGSKAERQTAADELTRGAPAAKVGGQAVPGVPSIDDQLALSVALDMAFDNHVSRQNAKLLHQAGIRVADLPGAKSYRQAVGSQRRAKGASRRAIRGAASVPIAGSIFGRL